MVEHPGSVGQLADILRQGGYLADRGLATALYLSMSLPRPILLEGEVGVGKTEAAKVLAAVFGRKLIRLQCYEGIDTNQALYEWDYARQMLAIRALSERQVAADDAVDQLFGPKFLLERPLLHAVRAGDQAVLLIDEVDRADVSPNYWRHVMHRTAQFQRRWRALTATAPSLRTPTEETK